MAEERVTSQASPRLSDGTWHLFLAEYESLRDESARAHDSQHHILQWSLAAYGVLLLAALAFTETEAADGATRLVWPDPYLMQLGFFVIVLPLLLTASMLVWLAELYRIERVGAYLRSRERAWCEATFPDEPTELRRCLESPDYPLMWENVIQGPGKKLRNFATGFLLYGVALLFALAVYGVSVWTSGRALAFQVVASVVGLLVFLLYRLLIPWKFRRDMEDVARQFPEPTRQYAGTDPCSPLPARLFYRAVGLSDLCPPKEMTQGGGSGSVAKHSASVSDESGE